MPQRQIKAERKVTYDVDVDAAYVYLVNHIDNGAAVTQRIVAFPGVGEVILDFDDDGRLLGIEVLGASELLPRELLDHLSQDASASDERHGHLGSNTS